MKNLNFNTTNGLPFPRITNLQISYPLPPTTPVLTYTEVQCVKDADGNLHIIEGSQSEGSIPLDTAMGRDPIQLVSPSTGADIEGATTNYTSLMMSVLAITRRDQKARQADAEKQDADLQARIQAQAEQQESQPAEA